MDALVHRAAEVGSAQELAQLLRELRRRHARHRRESELSYRELAARTGWSHAAIAEYMSGRTLPPTDRLDGLARLLGASAAELGAIATARDRVEESRRGSGNSHASGPSTVPRQLPAVATHFVGRAAELAALADLAERAPEAGTVVISALAGMAGIGKTALAVYAGHRMAQRFPDGQMFVDLHGFTAGMEPVPAAEALDRLLRDAGVPGERIPSGVEERAGMWRSVLADRRMLVVLDNAVTEDQVRPLLPGGAGCLVLVTSRRRLTGLDTTHAVSLDTLSQADAVELFLSTADRPDLTAEAPGVLEAVRLCGQLPLAIRIAAARLKHRRVWTVSDLNARLREVAGLTALDDGVHAAVHLSYQHLSPAAQRLCRLLALHPGPDVEPYAAAALTGGTPDEAWRLLDGLTDDHMLEEPSPGRFQFHDLVRAYAAKMVAGQESQAQQQAALTRLLDHYRHTAASAMTMVYPHPRWRRPEVPPAATPALVLEDRGRAESWLNAELANQLAVTLHGRTQHTCQLSAILSEHLFIRGRYRDAEALHLHALAIARDLGNRPAEIDSLNVLGFASRMLGRHDQASDHFGQALRIAQEMGDRAGELKAQNGLGHLHRMLGRHDQAAGYFRETLRLAQEIGDPVGELQALTGLAQVHRMFGRPEQAAGYFGQTLRLAQEIGDPVGELQALTGLGQIDRLMGRHERAAGYLELALRIAQEIGDPAGELQALNGLGFVHRMLGSYERAADDIGRALRIAQRIGDRSDELYALNSLAEARFRLGHHDEAGALYRAALEIAEELDSDNWRFEAQQGMGRLCRATGQPGPALLHHEQALALATRIAQPTDQARAHDGLAYAHHALGQHDQARVHWQAALEILTSLGTDNTDDVDTNVADIRANLRGSP